MKDITAREIHRSMQEPHRPDESGKARASSRWSDIAARVFLVVVIVFVIWLVRIRLG